MFKHFKEYKYIYQREIPRFIGCVAIAFVIWMLASFALLG